MTQLSLANLKIPALGLGTWQAPQGEVGTAVKTALEKGYRLIDCAYAYGNEAEIGSCIEEAVHKETVSRNNIFIISKLWNTKHHTEDVEPSLRECLTSLRIDCLDLYLIHWPISFKPGKENFPKDSNGNILYDDVHYLDTWKAMEKCVEKGLTKNIGLSNFNSIQIQDILDHCTIRPSVLQIEVHPYFSQDKLVAFCQERNITVIAYSPFGSPMRPWANMDNLSSPLADPKLKVIAGHHKKSAAQVILRWLLQRNIVAIPKSVNPQRLEENLQIFDFELSAEDMTEINSLNKNERMIVPRVNVDGKLQFRDAKASHFPFLADY